MSSDDIAKPRRRTLAEEVFGGADTAKDTFTSELGAALVAHGGVPSHRLDGFKAETEHGAYNTFDLITSAPMLATGIRATGDAFDAEPWAYENPEERSNRIHQHSMSVDEDAREWRQQLRRRNFQPTPPEAKPIAKIKYRSNFDPAKLLSANLDDVLDPTCVGMTRPTARAPLRHSPQGSREAPRAAPQPSLQHRCSAHPPRTATTWWKQPIRCSNSPRSAGSWSSSSFRRVLDIHDRHPRGQHAMRAGGPFETVTSGTVASQHRRTSAPNRKGNPQRWN